MSSIVASALKGTTVEVKSNLLPPVTLDLHESVTGEANAIARLVRLAVTVRRDGKVIAHNAPNGEPNPNGWLFALGLLVLLMAFFIVLIRSL